MNVAVHNASWSTFGGGEKYSCAIADVLGTAGHRVTILADRPEITLEKLRSYFNLELQGSEVVQCDRASVRKQMTRADLACIVSNFRPYGTPGRSTLYVLQIPYPPITLASAAARFLRGDMKEAAKDLLRRRLFADARKADVILVYSEFVRECLKRNHSLACTVLYPPIDDFRQEAPKEQVILSVGRIFRGLYNDKRYDVMLDAFRRLCGTGHAGGWEYWIAGSCGDDPASQEYLAELKERATGLPVRFFVNTPYKTLCSLYGRATIFWHAAGFGVDERREPHRTEHFGMSTVESMSASCVPVVVNNGGQREIVTHGVNGFLWNTVEELVSHTAELCGAALDPFRAQARRRYADFSRAEFGKRLQSIVNSIGVTL
jgi:glycosyltransferase involved in cell wall biosynthesis